MPYCYVEDMSIVAMLRVSVRAPSSRDALFRLKQCSVFWAFFLERGHVAIFCFWGFLLGGRLQQVGDTCEKSFTNNSSRVGCVCMIVRLNRKKREGSLQTIMVHFFSIFQQMF